MIPGSVNWNNNTIVNFIVVCTYFVSLYNYMIVYYTCVTLFRAYHNLHEACLVHTQIRRVEALFLLLLFFGSTMEFQGSIDRRKGILNVLAKSNLLVHKYYFQACISVYT